ELAGQLLQVVGSQLHVLGDAAGLLHLVDELLKVLLAHFHHHVGVHLDEAAVAVPGPAGVAGLLGQHVHHVLVQTQIQDGVHHAGHGGPGAGTHGDQQGVLQIAELLAGDALQLGDILHDLRLDPVVDLLAVLIVLGAGLGGDGEALGHRQANV
ncbi:transcriptional regulator NrdR, partial [Dysosmobacter welbionis]